MDIESPGEAVYYYEASNGRFRLTYFIPLEELQQLNQAGRISEEVLKDYPDGVDLDCTKPDYEEFEAFYAYRPPYDPEALQRAFYAIFSGTRNWKKFRGSGMMRADMLEEAMVTVEDSLRQTALAPEKSQPIERQRSHKERRRLLSGRGRQQKRMTAHLKKMKVKGVDTKYSLAQQDFPEIRMNKGRSIREVVTKLHRQQRGL